MIMYVPVFICVALVFIGGIMILVDNFRGWNSAYYAVFPFGTAVGLTIILLIATPAARLMSRMDIAEFQAVEQVVLTARRNNLVDPVELAALQKEITMANKWLAVQKTRRRSVFGLGVDPKIETLQPIQ